MFVCFSGGATTYTTPSSYGMPSSSYSTTAPTATQQPPQVSQPSSWPSSINTAALSAAVSSIAQPSNNVVRKTTPSRERVFGSPGVQALLIIVRTRRVLMKPAPSVRIKDSGSALVLLSSTFLSR